MTDDTLPSYLQRFQRELMRSMNASCAIPKPILVPPSMESQYADGLRNMIAIRQGRPREVLPRWSLVAYYRMTLTRRSRQWMRLRRK